MLYVRMGGAFVWIAACCRFVIGKKGRKQRSSCGGNFLRIVVWPDCSYCCHGEGMGLRYLTFRITSLTIALTVVGLYLVSRFFFLSNFVEMECRLVANDVQRAQNALGVAVDRLGLLAADWAAWDEAYAFMDQGGEAFLDSNLTRETFGKQRLAVVVFLDLAGKIRAGQGYDQDTDAFTALPEALTALFTPKVELLARADSQEGRQGLVMLDGRPMLLAALPILDSEHRGPARGTLVMGSWFDEATVHSLATATVLDMRLVPLAAHGLPAPGESAVILPVSEDAQSRTGLGLVRDIFNAPALWVSVTANRDFFMKGLGLIHSSLGLFGLAGLVIFVVLQAFLERRILRPLQTISALSGRIAKGETTLRLHLPGRDELASLALDLNAMLDRLDVAHRSLTASENRYRTLFFGIGAATVLVGPDGVIELANPAFTRLVGLPRVALEGARRWTDFCPDMAAAAAAGMLYAPETDAPAVQTRFVCDDGQTRHVLLAMATLGNQGHVVSLVDNTQAKKAEQALAALSRDLEVRVAERTEEARVKTAELEVANARLRELDRIKSSLLSSVSHELRTPLTAIRGFAALIERDLDRLVATSRSSGLDTHPRLGRIRENLRIINEENLRLTGLINDFLDLSKIEAGRMEWRDSAVGADELADRARRATASLFEAGPVELVVSVDPATPRLFADSDRMLQVAINLLSNARKATASGQVRLTIAPDAEGNWTLRVADTGTGIAPQDLERIFDSFTQAESLRSECGGTGLGLSICRTIVEHYGGRIWAESRPGAGSVFTVSIPRTHLFVDPV
jgi:PAS domain S-box-containing protein